MAMKAAKMYCDHVQATMPEITYVPLYSVFVAGKHGGAYDQRRCLEPDWVFET